jgi:hypothetical protein
MGKADKLCGAGLTPLRTESVGTQYHKHEFHSYHTIPTINTALTFLSILYHWLYAQMQDT